MMSSNAYEYNGFDNVPRYSVCICVMEGVASIPHHSFYKCPNLESVTIPYSIRIIHKLSFSKCRSLITIRLPPSIKEIHKFAFSGCNNLSNIDIPSTVKKINLFMFEYCLILKKLLFHHLSLRSSREPFMNVPVWCRYLPFPK